MHPFDADDAAAAMKRQSAGDLAQRLGIELDEVRRGSVTGRMPVEGNTQPMGLLHGGASAALAETLGSIAALLAAPQGMAAVGTDLHATHLRSARSGWVYGAATPIREGKRLAVYRIEVRDEGQQLLCDAKLTCLFVQPGA